MASHAAITANLDPSPTASDNEGGEKPVREQLKKTSIDQDTIPSQNTSAAQPSNAMTSNKSTQGLRRKRSIELVDRDASEDENGHIVKGRHARKRSRDITKDSSDEQSIKAASGTKSDASSEVDNRPGTPDDETEAHESSITERIASPKGKRNREQFLKDDDDIHVESLNGAVIPTVVEKDTIGSTVTAASKDEERDAKRHREAELKESTDVKVATDKKELAAVRFFVCLLIKISSNKFRSFPLPAHSPIPLLRLPLPPFQPASPLQN
jgi:Ran-binding protein 3